jgi:transcriptional regulator with XRE-family HTH domain
MNGAKKLRAYLEAKRLTHEQFAEHASVPGPQVSLWLSGKRRPGLESAFKIERATGGAVKAADWVPASKGRRPAPHRAAARGVDRHT